MTVFDLGRRGRAKLWGARIERGAERMRVAVPQGRETAKGDGRFGTGMAAVIAAAGPVASAPARSQTLHEALVEALRSNPARGAAWDDSVAALQTSMRGIGGRHAIGDMTDTDVSLSAARPALFDLRADGAGYRSSGSTMTDAIRPQDGNVRP